MSDNNPQPDWFVEIIKDSLSKLSPTNKLLGAVLLLLVGLNQPWRSFDNEPVELPNQSKIYTQHNGRADYERLKIGMDLVKVKSILGRGNEIEQSETTSTFIWKNADNSSITVLFENGKLKSKSQFKLE